MGDTQSHREFAKQSIAWAAIFAAGCYFVHPESLTHHNIEYGLGLQTPSLLDVYWFSVAFGFGAAFLTRRMALAASGAWRSVVGEFGWQLIKQLFSSSKPSDGKREESEYEPDEK